MEPVEKKKELIQELNLLKSKLFFVILFFSVLYLGQSLFFKIFKNKKISNQPISLTSSQIIDNTTTNKWTNKITSQAKKYIIKELKKILANIVTDNFSKILSFVLNKNK